MVHATQVEIGGKTLVLEAGRVARQADGAVTVRYGDTVVLATVVADKNPSPGLDFFPLTVEYRERAYAGGRIPGGFFKREGRPGEREILTSRLIDRPLRPLFPKGFRNEVQIFAIVLSADTENDPDILAMVGASAAVHLAGIPFNGPVGAVRVGFLNGTFVANPTYEQLDQSTLDLVVAGSEDAVLMVEAGGKEVPEETMLEAVMWGHAQLQATLKIQQALAELAGKPKWAFDPSVSQAPEIEAQVRQHAAENLRTAILVHEKQARAQAVDKAFDEVFAAMGSDEAQRGKIREYFEKVEKEEVRRAVLDKGIRVDGRPLTLIRPIHCETRYLPRAHGSALFTRGETQALVAVTLGTKEDEQKVELFEGEFYKPFMLHYNFPPFSVGEVRRIMSPGRREIGHGALAERAVQPILPKKEEFPYTIRIVSDILESNGSSSMATVCGASLALMDAGVPVKSAVAGIAMGLIKEGDRVAILTDIMGTEDHYGDMDFKVAGTEKGIVALQMDIKIGGVGRSILGQALTQAREARMFVLGKMREAISAPSPELSPYAPRFVTIKIKTDKIREIIGPGGKVIRGIQEETGVKIDVEDDGRVTIFASDSAATEKALAMIQGIVKEAELGGTYTGKVKKVVDFGAFVEIFPGTEGLLHISQIDEQRVRAVEDVLKEGDEVLVKVIEVEPSGKIRLSRRAALREKAGLPPEPIEPRPQRSGDRGDRPGGRGRR